MRMTSSAEPRILLVGSNGMLGRELGSACGRYRLPLVSLHNAAQCDVTDAQQVWSIVHEVNPTVILNATAYTDVDGAESSFDQALSVNGQGPGNLARACCSVNALLVHFSTDYVFNGHSGRPYRVEDLPDPVNSYGLSKLAGEEAIASSGCEYMIVRTSWLFASHGRNFVTTIRSALKHQQNLYVVDDQYGRPTSCSDLAEMTLKLMAATARRSSGDRIARIVHATNSGQCSWYELACEIARLCGIECRITPIKTDPAARPAIRPAFSVLDLADLVDLIGMPRTWREALAHCIQSLSGHHNSMQFATGTDCGTTSSPVGRRRL